MERKYIQNILGIGKARFFALVAKYQDNPDTFSIQYRRTGTPRRISPELEKNIIQELAFEKTLIQDPAIPLRSYNYSYIRDRLQKKVSLPTIIHRAKQHGFYLKHPKRKVHDREVLTNYAGELLQHDASYHQWSPYAPEKWYLISTLDDFSRFILYARLVQKETSWAHISAMETLFLKYGLPYSFYVDSHSVFRFVQGRDSVWRTHIHHAQRLLNTEVHRYNYQHIHSMTQEVPSVRLQQALKDNKSLFRPFVIKPPFVSSKDIFCLRLQRTLDGYRKVSVNNFVFKVNGHPYDEVELRIYPLNATLCEVRFWSEGKLIDVQKAKHTDLKLVHF